MSCLNLAFSFFAALRSARKLRRQSINKLILRFKVFHEMITESILVVINHSSYRLKFITTLYGVKCTDPFKTPE